MKRLDSLTIIFFICIILLLCSCGRTATWSGAVKSSSTALPISSSIWTYITAALDISVTVGTGDRVLLFANMGFKSTSATTASFLTMTIFRGTTDISGGNSAKFFGASVPKEASEIQGCSIAYLDTPSSGTYTYSIRGAGAVTFSPNGQLRQLAALVIPNSFPTAFKTFSTMTTFSLTTYGNANLDTSITPNSATDKVLVSVNINFNPNGGASGARYSLFRNNVQVDNYAMQVVRGGVTGLNRYATFIYLDSPQSDTAVAYSVRVSKELSADNPVDICDGNFDVAQMSLVAFPYYMANSASATDILTVSTTTWTVIGLTVTITTQLTTDLVMVTVNVNFYPNTAATVGAFSIFRGETNLGHTTYGLQSAKSPVIGESTIATMTFLDAPTTAGVITYTARARIVGGSFIVSKSGQTRQIAVIATNSPTAAPTAMPTRAPTFRPTAVPTTAAPSFSPTYTPTNNPTIIPTKQPTITPSAAPTLPPLDCSASCALSGDFTVSKNKRLRNLILSPYFKISFDIINPTLATSITERRNVFDLIDMSTGVSLLAVASTQNSSLQLSYNGVVLNPYGVQYNTDLSVTTSFIVHLYADMVRCRSSVNTAWTPWTPIFNERTTNGLYSLYISNPTDISAGGVMSNLKFTADLPTTMPTARPTTAAPSCTPSVVPSATPTAGPSLVPSASPSAIPSAPPTEIPCATPSTIPTVYPSALPSVTPSASPSAIPSETPTVHPSASPSAMPSATPTETPTARPSADPSATPSAVPSEVPTVAPSPGPSVVPSTVPTEVPTLRPSTSPSATPSAHPTVVPTALPSIDPTAKPSTVPTVIPTAAPTSVPTAKPSLKPTVIRTAAPSIVDAPSEVPTEAPTADPTVSPTLEPTASPSAWPTLSPTASPSITPSAQPTTQPSSQPSGQPSSTPSQQPSVQPTSAPTIQPSSLPSRQPSSQPSVQPSGEPSIQPSSRPSGQPTALPSTQPSGQPSGKPSSQPSSQPTDHPSSSPSSRPTERPSSQPSAQPNARPTAQPSSKPSLQPSVQPTSQPTSQPSRQPSSQPSMQPSGVPSVQPTSQPSSHPSRQPSSQPSRQPSSRPTTHPILRPTAQPSAQPSRQPSEQPSRQPTSQPSSAPSLFSTDEWVSVVNNTVLFKALSVINGSVWACGASADLSVKSASCALANAVTGELSTQFQFPWDTITSAITSNDKSKVMVSGRFTLNDVVSGEVAMCTPVATLLSCVVKSFQHVNFVKASYNAYGDKFVYVGQNVGRAAVSLFDVNNNSVRSFVYTAKLMTSIVLSQVTNPANFIGSFVAGTSVGSTSAAVKNIFAGWLRTDTGLMTGAIGITPVSGSIVSSTDLVTAMALEATGPDSFIAGGLQLSDGAGTNSYLVRANALYKNVQYGVRYVTSVAHSRRVLMTSTSVVSAALITSVVRGMALTNAALFVISDITQLDSNRTNLSVLKIRTSTGGIIKQAQVSAPTGVSLHCTDITAAGLLLTIACTVQRMSYAPQSLLIAVDRELTFFQLPAGFIKHGNNTFRAERVAMQATVITVKSPSTVVTITNSEQTISDRVLSRNPTAAPTLRPSPGPTSTPSAQPSSSPTPAPSVSTHPTSQPSTSGPTNTPKPTFSATVRPTAVPSAGSTARPSASPSLSPSARPTEWPSTTRPTAPPSEAPTVSVTSSPTVRPTRAPTATPSTRSAVPSRSPSAVEEHVSSNGGKAGTPTFVIGASVGAAVCFGLCGLYVLYRRRARNQKFKIAIEQKRGMKSMSSVVPSLATSLSVEPPMTTFAVREPTWYPSSSDTNNNSIIHRNASVLSSRHSPSLSRSVSATHSSGFTISSLHSSEQSLEYYSDQSFEDFFEEDHTNSLDGSAEFCNETFSQNEQ